MLGKYCHFLKSQLSIGNGYQGSKLSFFQGAQQHFQEVLCIETSTSLGSLQKYEQAAGEFKGALGSRLVLIFSPGYTFISHM